MFFFKNAQEKVVATMKRQSGVSRVVGKKKADDDIFPIQDPSSESPLSYLETYVFKKFGAIPESVGLRATRYS